MISLKKQVLLCTFGTMLEWYDFSLFASLTVIISSIFFPKTDTSHAIMYTFMVFASGFLMRPIGAIFFGHLGDKIGRKSTLLLTIFLITLSTTVIGLIPTGMFFSTTVLIGCRLFQGFAASGEYAGGITLLSEQPSDKKGFISSFGIFSAIIGIFFGSLVCTIISKLIGDQLMTHWGWRIPFLLGAPIGILGYFLRKSLLESTEFIKTQNENLIQKIPLLQLLKKYKFNLISLFCMYVFSSISFYINFVYLNSYLIANKNIGITVSMFINSLTILIYAICILFFGFISDFFNKKYIMMLGCILMVILIHPLFTLILKGTYWEIILAQSIISILIGMFVGPIASLSIEFFPINVRYTGVAIALNFSAAIFGGTAPLICAWLAENFNSYYAPAYYFMFATILAFLATFSSHRKYSKMILKS